MFAVAKSCLQNAQEITLQSATKAKSKPKNPPPPVPVKPLSMTAHRTDQQIPSPAAAPPLPVRPHIVQHAPSPTNTTITPSSNDNNITVWKSIKPVVSPLLPFKNRLFDSSDDDVTIFEDDDEDILDFDNDGMLFAAFVKGRKDTLMQSFFTDYREKGWMQISAFDPTPALDLDCHYSVVSTDSR